MASNTTHGTQDATIINPQLIQNELRIRDLDLAQRLGFDRPRDIRKIIKRYEAELGQLGVCATVAQTSGAQGGRPTTEYYLNKKQAIFITAKSETPEATEITIEVIERFDAYESGKQVIAPRKRRPAVLTAFNTGYRIALNLGYDKNQAMIYGDRYCRNKCGESPVEMMGMTSLAAPDNDNYLTPTELGEKLGGLSGRRVNKMLAEVGLQTSTPGSATGSNWTMTEAGKAYGRLFDTTRKNGTGSQQQLKWKPSVLDVLSGKGEAA